MRLAHWKAALFALMLMWGLQVCRASGQVSLPERRVLQAFDYQGVTLEEGPLRRQFDAVRDYYLHIPNDNLLKGFRRRAGRYAPGTEMGGWYSSDTFHIFGQILSGLARMYAATGDTACRDKANTLLAEWARCIEKDGYFYYSRTPNAPHYIYDKMVGGLVDMYVYAGNRDALPALSRITDWAIAHLDRRNVYAYNAGDGPTEWYTLSENLYRVYLATGDPKYRDFAKVWEYTDYWDLYARRGDIFGTRPDGGQTLGYHAYSHVNTLGGAGAAYRVFGKPSSLQTLIGAYDTLQAHQCVATGGFGPDEQLLPPDALADHLRNTHNSFETQCGSWAAFKLCKHLMELTGDARYGDWVEKLVLNGIGASIPMTGDGRVFYYSDYNPDGAVKRNIDTGWTCCAGTRPMAVADYHALIYFHTADSLCVNLYTPSSVRRQFGGTTVTLRQTTRFPESEEARFALKMARPVRFALRLRAPGWLNGEMRVAVNGRPIPARPDAQHWVTLRCTWRDGDQVQVLLPMALRVVRFQPDRPYPLSLMCGPVSLALQSSDGILPRVALRNLPDGLQPAPGEPLVYRLASAPSLLVRPFYALGSDETYFLAFDPTAPTRIGPAAITFHPDWNEGGRIRYCNVVGATAEASFEGTGVRWLGYRYDDAGRGEVRIDGKVVAVVDQYGPGRELPFDWHVEGLALGKHTVKITLLEEKTAASRDRYLNIAGLEVTDKNRRFNAVVCATIPVAAYAHPPGRLPPGGPRSPRSSGTPWRPADGCPAPHPASP